MPSKDSSIPYLFCFSSFFFLLFFLPFSFFTLDYYWTLFWSLLPPLRDDDDDDDDDDDVRVKKNMTNNNTNGNNSNKARRRRVIFLLLVSLALALALFIRGTTSFSSLVSFPPLQKSGGGNKRVKDEGLLHLRGADDAGFLNPDEEESTKVAVANNQGEEEEPVAENVLEKLGDEVEEGQNRCENGDDDDAMSNDMRQKPNK